MNEAIKHADDPATEGPLSLSDRVSIALGKLAPAEQRMARFFVDQKQAVLLNSAADIAEKAGTSDATVVRTARSLGFDGLASLREAILSELTEGPAGRLTRTLAEIPEGRGGVLAHILQVHRDSLEVMASADFADGFDRAVHLLHEARNRFVFGIGPSGSIAQYAALQFNRIGLGSSPLSESGIALADRLTALEKGDVILMFAYAPIYREVAVVLDQADENGVPVILVSDSLGAAVRKRVAEVLPVPRGKADHLSMHGATLVLLEAMIVALAAKDRGAALASLKKVGALRGKIDKLWQKRGVER